MASPSRSRNATSTWSLRNNLDVKAERPEAIVAADHGALGIAHPAVVKIAFPPGQGLDKRTHGIPSRRAHPFRTLSVLRNPLLSFPNVTSVFDGVLILCHQVGIHRLANRGDTYVSHLFLSVKIINRMANRISATPRATLRVNAS